MVEGPDELGRVQVVQVGCAIKGASDEETHLVADENGGDLSLMVEKSLVDMPWVGLRGAGLSTLADIRLGTLSL